ncbi:MAG: hypothetical protein P8X89_08500 [Reinekea sp.]
MDKPLATGLTPTNIDPVRVASKTDRDGQKQTAAKVPVRTFTGKHGRRMKTPLFIPIACQKDTCYFI